MAHRRTYSSRKLDMSRLDIGKASLDSPPITPALAVFNSFYHSNASTSKPRQYWQRTTVLALLALILLSGYILLVSQPSLAPITPHDKSPERTFTSIAAEKLSRLSTEAHRLAALHGHKSSKSHSSSAETASDAAAAQVRLTPEQELAAVTSFLASLPQNVIPSNVDPLHPIDPQLVLDFDTRSPQALQEVEQLVVDSWARYPVVLYSKVRASYVSLTAVMPVLIVYLTAALTCIA